MARLAATKLLPSPGIPLAIIYGSRERDAGVVKLKDLRVTDTTISNEHEVARAGLVAKVAELLG